MVNRVYCFEAAAIIVERRTVMEDIAKGEGYEALEGSIRRFINRIPS